MWLTTTVVCDSPVGSGGTVSLWPIKGDGGNHGWLPFRRAHQMLSKRLGNDRPSSLESVRIGETISACRAIDHRRWPNNRTLVL
jgi:hypothetical protein